MTAAAQPLQTSLREEEQMAAWIDQHVGDITLQFLRNAERAEAGA